MKIWERASKSLVRKFGKTSVLFFLVLIIGVVELGATLVEQAVRNTNENLKRKMPSQIFKHGN